MKTYEGNRDFSGGDVAAVRVRDGEKEYWLDPRHDVRNHSPTGFEWGYSGSGPAQLALALCIDALDGDRQRAERVYQQFKFRMIAGLSSDSWRMTQDYIVEAIRAIEQERPQ